MLCCEVMYKKFLDSQKQYNKRLKLACQVLGRLISHSFVASWVLGSRIGFMVPMTIYGDKIYHWKKIYY